MQRNEDAVQKFNKLLKDLQTTLMRYEVDLEDQFEDNFKEFERTIVGLVDQFIEMVEVRPNKSLKIV